MFNSTLSSHHLGVFKQARKEGHGAVSMFGVLHFGNDCMYPLPEKLQETFEAADCLAFETDLDALSSSDFNHDMTRQGTLERNESLAEKLSPQLWQELLETAATLGFSEQYLKSLQPWYCSMLLTSAALRQTGLDSCKGLDATLFQKAKEQQKNILCLETPEKQLAMLTTVNQEECDAFMRQTLEEIADMPHFTRTILQSWQEGDQDKLAELLEEGFAENPTLHRHLLDQRNLDWFQQLKETACQGHDVLAVVGAGHLIGSQSLPYLFQSHGFAVDDPVAANAASPGSQPIH